MGKRPEDEIQKKLVELELSIKDDGQKEHVPAVQQKSTAVAASSAEDKMAADMCNIGGWGLIGAGSLYVLSRIQVVGMFNFLLGNPMYGLLLLPLFAGMA